MKKRIRDLAAVLMVVVFGIVMGSSHGAFGAEPIILGAPGSMSVAEGDVMEKGMTLAMEEINAQGGVQVGGEKRPFELIVMDTRDCEPGVPVSEALLVVERLILNKKANFIVGGPIRTEAYHAAMDLFSRYKTVSLVNTGVYSPTTAKRIADNYEKYRYSFRLTGHVGAEIMMDLPQLLKNMKEQHGFSRAYIMVQDVAHARKSGEIVGAMLPKWGWEVLGQRIYPTGAADFALGLLEAKKKQAQLLWVWMDMPEVAIFMKQWADLEVPALPMGYARPAQEPDFWKMTDGKSAYSVLTVLNAGNVPTKLNPWAERFNQAWIKRWGKEPSGYACSAPYMSLYVLKDAIERANSLESEAVIAALEKTDIKDGVYGRIIFDPKSHDIVRKHDPAEGALGAWFQWQDGKRVSIFPEAVATGDLKLPPWLKK